MNMLTIPQKLARSGDLVVLPKKEYEKLSRFWASAERLTNREKKSVERGFREIAQGKFFTSRQVKHALGL